MTDDTLIIDPPVTPFSPPDDIRAWLRALTSLRADTPENSPARETVDEAVATATDWLTMINLARE